MVSLFGRGFKSHQLHTMIRVTKEAPFGVLFCSRELLQTHGIYRTSVDGCWKRLKLPSTDVEASTLLDSMAQGTHR